MMHDPDPFNRWQAAQSYATNLLTAAARDGWSAEPVHRQGGHTACAGAWHDGDGNIALRRLSRRVPQAAERIRHRTRARQERRPRCGAQGLRDAPRHHRTQDPGRPWRRSMTRAAMSGPFSPDAESAGKRALRSAILDLLAGTGERAEIDRALRHYRDATNMTDAISALSILLASRRPRRGARRFL